MKDAVGSTMLVYIVIIVVGIVGAIMVASNMYTSAYKAKNNIVSIINRHYQVHDDTNCFGEEGVCTNSILATLKNMGYHTKVDCSKYIDKVTKKAREDDDGNSIVSVDGINLGNDNKGYCIYKVTIPDGYYYTVITFSHLNINVLGIGSLFSTPVYGETRTFY